MMTSEPPRRPNKSRLRALPDRISTSDNSSAYSEGSPTSSYRSSPTPKYSSRFIEHFDRENKETIFNEYIISPLKKRPDIKTSKSLNTKNSSELHLPLDHLLTTTTAATKRVQLTPSLSTPLQMPNTIKPRKFGSNGSVLSANTSKISVSPISLNRADVIITRFESWLLFLKSITNWVEEVAKINLISSRGYYQRAYPYLDESAAISTTTTTLDSSTLVQQNVNQSILTVQAGFQVLTMQIAAEQQAFSKSLEHDYLPGLNKLRKECKETIHKLKNDQGLALDELLRRAEITRSKMTNLNRYCKQAEKSPRQQLEMDPWVANLLVLRQLKKEVDEENRLRLLMIPIQKEAQAFEKRLLELVKPTIQYCYETLAPGAWEGTENKEVAPFKLLMDQIMPNFEWNTFTELQKKDLVNEDHPTKDYLKINYPNKFHPMVMTLLKGKMERKYGVRKQFVERNYVLSQGGYLHQFTIDDKVLPEKTLYIPSTTIVPSIDISHISSKDQNTVLQNTFLDKTNTFEICKAASSVLQRDKISLFRTTNRQELITWCRLLIHFSCDISLSTLGVVTDDTFTRQSSISSLEVESFPFIPEKLNESPSLSLRSVKTEESFNEPLIMNKKGDSRLPPTTKITSLLNDDSLKTPTTTSFPVEYITSPKEYEVPIVEHKEPLSNFSDSAADNNTDAESFVTAKFNDTDDQDDTEDNDDIDIVVTHDYFSIPLREDDTISIASTSTAKGPNSGQGGSPAETSTPEFFSSAASLVSGSEFISSATSIASTTFDDAQSSLYFSSGSAPTSPVISSQSSIVSIPDFSHVPEVTLPTTSAFSNNTQLSAAQLYKATLI